jgi:hypothetical protein
MISNKLKHGSIQGNKYDKKPLAKAILIVESKKKRQI